MASREPSIEEVLEDYASPFVAVGWASANRASQLALETAALIWDLVLDGLDAAEIAGILDEDGDEHVTKLVAAFVQRKHALFAGDRRYVVGPRISASEGHAAASRAAS